MHLLYLKLQMTLKFLSKPNHNLNNWGIAPQFYLYKDIQMKCAIKYAPQSLAEVIYPDQTVKTRITAYATGLLESHVILHGPNGTGKSSVSRLLPDAIVGGNAIIESKDFDEILNKPNLRSYLRNACTLNSLSTQQKVFMVFEEFDNAKVNINKLWTAMDACSDQLQIIISTNRVMHIHQSLRSRCDIIQMGKLTAQAVLPRAQFILNNEGLNLSDEYVLAYLQRADWKGDLRLYMQQLDELLATQAMNMPLPAVHTPTAANYPSLQAVSGGRQ